MFTIQLRGLTFANELNRLKESANVSELTVIVINVIASVVSETRVLTIS